MITSTLTKAFDGDYEILFSYTFSVYENKLVIKDIAGFDFEFNFLNDPSKVDSSIEIQEKKDDKPSFLTLKKILVLNLYNFRNPLGIGTTSKLEISKLKDGRSLYFSIHAKSLNETTSFLLVTLNFYLK